MVTASGLGKRFGARWLFRDLNFELVVGDALLVRGPNGSGKSTLLKIAASLISASEGSVAMPEGDVRTRIGYSALDLATYPLLTAAEHLVFAAELRGCEPRTDELLGQVGLSDARDQHAGEFSSGMRARLKLALAVQAKPAVLILDEPGASLDEEGRSLVESIVAEQRTRGVCLIASNDPGERRLGTHALELA